MMSSIKRVKFEIIMFVEVKCTGNKYVDVVGLINKHSSYIVEIRFIIKVTLCVDWLYYNDNDDK